MAATPPTLQNPKVERNGTQGAPSQGRLVVALNPRPRDYVPNSGPPAPRVTLLPPEDSTAYIMDRLFLPPKGLAEKDGKPLPKRMIYIIGWRDLPAARIMVPVMKVLDYVSPAALEKWESANEEELDIEREELERRLGLEEKKEPIETAVDDVQPTKKRKRGRPPTKMRMEPATAADMEDEHDAKASLKGGALALSATPKKALMKELERLDDGEIIPSRLVGRLVLGMDNTSDSQSGHDVIDAGNDEDQFYDAEEGMHIDLATTAPSSQLLEESQPASASEDLAFWGQPALPTTQVMAGRSSDPAAQGTPGEASSRANLASWKPFGLSRGLPRFSSDDASSCGSPAPVASQAKQGANFKKILKPQSNKKKEKKTTEKTEKKKTESSSQLPSGPDEEREWIVERIEDFDHYEVEGRGIVRYFKVRWEGDWPPEQNPSWEPEENLPPKLVRNYFKMGKKRLEALKKPKDRTPKSFKQTTLSWTKAKRYSNVSEAFAGEDEDQKAPGGNDVDGDDDDNDRPDDNILGHLEDMNSDADAAMGVLSRDDEVFVVDDNPPVISTPRFDWGENRNRLSFFGP